MWLRHYVVALEIRQDTRSPSNGRQDDMPYCRPAHVQPAQTWNDYVSFMDHTALFQSPLNSKWPVFGDRPRAYYSDAIMSAMTSQIAAVSIIMNCEDRVFVSHMAQEEFARALFKNTLRSSDAYMHQWAVSPLVSDNGLLLMCRQALIEPMMMYCQSDTKEMNFSEYWIKIRIFSFNKTHFKRWPAKWQPFRSGLNVSTWSGRGVQDGGGVGRHKVTTGMLIELLPSRCLWNAILFGRYVQPSHKTRPTLAGRRMSLELYLSSQPQCSMRIPTNFNSKIVYCH